MQDRLDGKHGKSSGSYWRRDSCARPRRRLAAWSRTGAHTGRLGQVADKPLLGKPGHLIQRAWLGEQVGCARDDLELAEDSEAGKGPLDSTRSTGLIVSADDQERGHRSPRRETPRARSGRPPRETTAPILARVPGPPPRVPCPPRYWRRSSRPSSPASRAWSLQPVASRLQPAGQQPDVEDVACDRRPRRLPGGPPAGFPVATAAGTWRRTG